MFGSHFGKNFTEGGITVHCYVLINVFRIDNTAVTKSYSLLSFVECCVVKRDILDVFFFNFITYIRICKMFNNTAFKKMLRNDFGNIVLFNLAVECTVGINDNNRTESAKTEATGSYDLNFF